MEYKFFTDKELLQKLANNDVAAFDEIYRRYWSEMFNSAYNILRDKDSCMDIVQELFIWLWERRDKLEIVSLKAYLLGAVKYKIANYIRKGRVRTSFFAKIKKEEEPINLVEESVEVNELISAINHFTNQLPAKCKEVFLLSRKEHLTNREIAEQMGISVKTVENQITIALKKLKTSLARIYFFLLLFF